jgi:hypothetical protein
MVEIDEKDLYQLLIAEFRYSVKRDNHLAPSGCVWHIGDYLPKMSKQWRVHTAEQLTAEIIEERVLAACLKHPLEQDEEWEALQLFLTDYIERLPYNIDRYMEYLYKKSDSANIDYFSEEITTKLKVNQRKK